MHDKVNHIQAFAVGGAVGGKAVAGLSFIVDLQTGRTIFVERTVQPVVLVGLVAVVLQDIGYRQSGLDLGAFQR